MATVIPDAEVKQGETLRIDAQLLGRGDVPADLTLATGVRMIVRPPGGGTAVYDVACGFIADATGTVSYESPAVVAVPVDDYELEFKASYPGPKVRKFPTEGFYVLRVYESAS